MRALIDYEGRKFLEDTTDPEADVPVVHFHQQGELIWAQSTHHGIHHGSLTGRCTQDGTLEFGYAMLVSGGTVVSGHSIATPEVLPDGRIKLTERWERYGAGAATGVSDFIEVFD